MNRQIIISCLAAVLLFNNCARNPVTGKREVVLMSEQQELAMGKEADPQIIAQYGLLDNKDLQNFITEKGKAMAAISHRPNINYEFRILDSDVLNAFAIPGGYVYFTRGIMAYLNNEAQFAGVLGHEIGHIAARHSVEQQRNAMLGQIGLMAGIVLAPGLSQFAETASQGLSLLLLKFGRDAEREADRLGVEYSSKIAYDAKEMAGFFTTLEREQQKGDGEELPEFLSTHPNPGDRHTTVAKLATEWKQKLNLTNAKINRDEYLKRIEGIVYGEDPRQGYLENSVFYHPQLKFQFPVPQGWSYQNTPQAVQVAPKDGKAMMMLTLAQGANPKEAANAVLQQYKLQVVESKELTVNGLPAFAMIADQQPQQQQQAAVRTLSYIIRYNDINYVLLGVSGLSDFNNYAPTFQNTMQNFRQLTDTSKLNKKPQRVRIKTVAQSGTLDQALRNLNMPANKLEELAILNGMQLNDGVTKGMLIKVIGE
ncbi:M48 family metalloprotease [Chitinophagaceae bacterium LB-8]|uniref:M48 family metalloprotease n=1 Tax=Paraflavisolibacter caeni TaxID=2982496 RepID=A0A9X2XSW2_9BACT|nr:M48 family metalloprotease [Paraflavisolibacter caeni]MCU7547767.1 M48 family metalloprotease [Paraflavisolibacter caeni]